MSPHLELISQAIALAASQTPCWSVTVQLGSSKSGLTCLARARSILRTVLKFLPVIPLTHGAALASVSWP